MKTLRSGRLVSQTAGSRAVSNSLLRDRPNLQAGQILSGYVKTFS